MHGLDGALASPKCRMAYANTGMRVLAERQFINMSLNKEDMS